MGDPHPDAMAHARQHAPIIVLVAVPDARVTAPQDVKLHVLAIAQTGAIRYVAVPVNIPVEALANMYRQDLHAQDVQKHAVHIVINLVVWRAAPAVCLVVYPHLNDIESDKRARSRLAIR